MPVPTPTFLEINPRDRRFGRGTTPQRWWHGGDPFATALFNALSVPFPKGEAFFIESLRHFREGLPSKLAVEVRAFTMQEVNHSREHVAFNRRVTDTGYDVSKLEAMIDARLAGIRARPPIASLAATVALEHLTATLSHAILTDPRHLAGMDEESRRMWRWHTLEEVEHKGVCYDVWLHATRDWPARKRWSVQAKVMALVTRNFVVDRTRSMLELLRQDGITGARAHAGVARYAFAKPGLLRVALGAWRDFLAPDFHPWNQDDRALIARIEREEREAMRPASPVAAPLPHVHVGAEPDILVAR
ncbi:MAG: metal-dependent hydrolase [Sphingomonadales bacterium]|nr:MAG: metal-dependent hydrolase [Sphingomonadales bacterium]